MKLAHPLDINFDTILKGCKARDRSAQNALYRMYYAYGMSIGIRYVKNEEEAIEILNDGFLKVFNRIKKYDDQHPFKPWFRKIIVNTAIDQMKRQNRLQMKTDLQEARTVEAREDILSRIGYKELLNIVHSLSIAYRTVFNMYVIDGYKHEEIANQLGISIGTSKSNLSKARSILQKRITKHLNLSNV